MVWEAFNTWAETDPVNRLTQTATRSTWTGLTRADAPTALVEDYGAGSIGTAFTYQFVLHISDIEAGDADNRVLAMVITAQNVPGAPDPDPAPRWAISAVEDADDDLEYTLRIRVMDTATNQASDTSSLLDVGTTYYITLVRSNLGKTLTVTIRTVSHVGPVEDTIVAFLDTFTETFRYLKVPNKQDYASDIADESTGYIEFLDIDAAAPAVAPQGTVVHKAMAMLIT